MHAIEEIIKKITTVIPILLVAWFLFWLAGILVPQISFKNLITNRDLLPPPGSMHTLGTSVYEPPVREDTWSTNWEMGGNNTSYKEPLLSYYSSQNLNPLYVRNVTVKKYSSVYSGMVIRGEVKRSFFALGTFPVFVEDMQKSRSFTQARALEPWQSGDWVKFEAVLGKISQKNQCNLVFKNANPAGDPHFDIYTSIPVYCI